MKKRRHGDAKADEMSWADVSAALSAGARPQDVVTGVRQLFTSGANENDDSALSPPPSPPPSSSNDVIGLYRKPLLPGTSSAQLCYLRAPLHVLEQLDKPGEASDDEGKGENGERFRFDSEFSFDPLSQFKLRLIAPISHDSLSLPRASTYMNGDSTLLGCDDVENGNGDGSIDLKTLGRLLAKGSVPALMRSRQLSYTDWTQAYPIYLAYTAISSPADAAISLVRDTSSCTLCTYILKERAPKLPPNMIASVVSACTRAISMSSSSHRGIRTNDVAPTIKALQISDPTRALDVLESLIIL